MNSMQGVKSPSFEETLIDLKLEKITIKQLDGLFLSDRITLRDDQD